MNDIKPGIYPGISMPRYIADPCPEPSLNAGTAHLLLTRSPLHAWYYHPQLGGHHDDSGRAELGSAVHEVILGGDRIVYADAEFEDWRKKEAREFRDKARVDGKTPMLARQKQQIEEIAGPAKERLQKLGVTKFEQTAIWREGDIWCRSRPDSATDDWMLVVDYKTATNAEPGAWVRSALSAGGYDIQAALLAGGLNILLDVPNKPREILWLVQEIDPPYDMSVIGMDPEFQAIAAARAERAIEQWASCLKRKQFAGYDKYVHYAEPPGWLRMEAEMLRET